MTEPFLGQITMAAFTFPPKGYALCNGATLPINQNQALYSLLGTTYGGDGQTSFALPNLQGRVPVHAGNGVTQGQAAGQASVTLTAQQLPGHTHQLGASSQDGDTQAVSDGVFAVTRSAIYDTPQSAVAMSAASVGSQGGSGAHPNMQPYAVLSFCIALQGIFPSRN